MRRKKLILLVVVSLIQAGLAGSAGGLEVFRIGGEDQPRPAQAGVDFHQLSWKDFAEKQGLDEDALAQGMVRPVFVQPEENIARTSLARGGGPYEMLNTWGSYGITDGAKNAVDGETTTSWQWILKIAEGFSSISEVQRREFIIDLGGLFYVNRVRLFTPLSQHGHYPDKLEVWVNPTGMRGGTAFTQSSPVGDLVYRLLENMSDTLDVSFTPALAQSVCLLLTRISYKDLFLAEIEVFGVGYPAQASYIAPFIDLKEPAIWGPIRWGGRKDPEARVWIESRAGKDLDPNVYWRFTGRGTETSTLDETGKPLTATSYAQLKPGEAAQVTYDTQNWSFWSAPYEFADNSGTSVLSPGPNSVFQLKVDFRNTPKDGGEVSFIEFSATQPPLAEDVLGEIYPPKVPLGETARFTYAIRPTIRAQHSGFDQIEIATPFGLAGVDSVKISGVPVEYTLKIERPDSTRFSVKLPRYLKTGNSGQVIEVVFRAPVLRYSTAFDGWVRDSERPLEVPQRINPGDAASELESEVLAVRTSFSGRLLNLWVEPKVITPNGDGTNEKVNFSFNVLQLTASTPLQVEVFDLSGRLLQVVYEGRQQSGRFNCSWDGRDRDGQVVPPGVYLYRVAVEAQQGEVQQTGTVAVVY